MKVIFYFSLYKYIVWLEISTRKYTSGYEKLKKRERKKKEKLIESILSIENEMLEKLKYKNLISQFASKKARKIDFK